MWIKKSYFLSIFALFAVLFGSCITTSSDVSAVADFSYTSTSCADFQICGGSSGRSCSDYSYLYLSVNSPIVTSAADYFILRSSFGSFLPNKDFQFSPSYLPVLLNPSSANYIKYSCSFAYPPGFELTFILSDNNPLQSSCPTCPEIPANPYDDKLDSIRNAIILVPAVCLLLYFFYVIFGIIIPTTGGKK